MMQKKGLTAAAGVLLRKLHGTAGSRMPRLLDVDIFTDVAGPPVLLDGYSDRGFSVNGESCVCDH